MPPLMKEALRVQILNSAINWNLIFQQFQDVRLRAIAKGLF